MEQIRTNQARQASVTVGSTCGPLLAVAIGSVRAAGTGQLQGFRATKPKISWVSVLCYTDRKAYLEKC